MTIRNCYYKCLLLDLLYFNGEIIIFFSSSWTYRRISSFYLRYILKAKSTKQDVIIIIHSYKYLNFFISMHVHGELGWSVTSREVQKEIKFSLVWKKLLWSKWCQMKREVVVSNAVCFSVLVTWCKVSFLPFKVWNLTPQSKQSLPGGPTRDPMPLLVN